MPHVSALVRAVRVLGERISALQDDRQRAAREATERDMRPRVDRRQGFVFGDERRLSMRKFRGETTGSAKARRCFRHDLERKSHHLAGTGGRSATLTLLGQRAGGYPAAAPAICGEDVSSREVAPYINNRLYTDGRGFGALPVPSPR